MPPKSALKQRIRGKDPVVELSSLAAMMAGGHVLLEGPQRCTGKTALAHGHSRPLSVAISSASR